MAHQQLVAADMLKDGSNPEGVDPVPPLEWKGKADFKDVVLHGMYISPPCCKIMAYLVKYDIPFKCTDGGNKPGSAYTKMPVLDVNGRQVNDSYIILKNMIPALTGKPINQEWEKICSYQLAMSIEDSLTPPEAAKWLSATNGLYGMMGLPSCLLKCCLAKVILDNMIKPGLKKNCDNPTEQMPWKILPLMEIGQKLKKDIGIQKFFDGNVPGNVDISFYGICFPFYFKEVAPVRDMISECGLQDWWDRMEKEIPPSKIYPM